MIPDQHIYFGGILHFSKPNTIYYIDEEEKISYSSNVLSGSIENIFFDDTKLLVADFPDIETNPENFKHEN